MGALLTHVVMFALSRGVELDRLVAETGLDPDLLLGGQSWHPIEALVAVWRCIDAHGPADAPALVLARSTPFTYFGAMGHGTQFAPDLRTLLRGLDELSAVMLDGLVLELDEGEHEARLGVSHWTDAHDGGHGAEATIGMSCRLLRDVIGERDALRRVEFAHARHGPVADYVDFFGVPVLFGRSWQGVVFDTAALDRPLATADPTLFAHVRLHHLALRDRLEALAAADALAPVRAAIERNAERGEYGVDALARTMGTGLRTLQRQVSSHGTTVRQMLDAARVAAAKALLRDRALSVAMVAEAVGYSAERAFVRAFKRWTGQTPAAWRRGR